MKFTSSPFVVKTHLPFPFHSYTFLLFPSISIFFLLSFSVSFHHSSSREIRPFWQSGSSPRRRRRRERRDAAQRRFSAVFCLPVFILVSSCEWLMLRLAYSLYLSSSSLLYPTVIYLVYLVSFACWEILLHQIPRRLRFVLSFSSLTLPNGPCGSWVALCCCVTFTTTVTTEMKNWIRQFYPSSWILVGLFGQSLMLGEIRWYCYCKEFVDLGH